MSKPQVNGVVSPDGTKTAFLRDYNLWVRDLNTDQERALTVDGELHFSYGTLPERMSLVDKLNPVAWEMQVPEILWSPDSDKLMTVQVDERAVLSLPVTEYVPAAESTRPYSANTKYAFPGDEQITEFHFISIDLKTDQVRRAKYPPIADAVTIHGPFSGNRAWWSGDSRQAFFLDVSRGRQSIRVVSFDIVSGSCHSLFEERCDTYIDLNHDFESPASLWPLVKSNELIWFSERTGSAHLYLYNLSTGKLKNAITQGNWVVREVLHMDEENRELLVLISGRQDNCDPYLQELCKVHIDSGQITTLAGSERHDYIVYKAGNISTLVGMTLGKTTTACSGLSSDGRYIVVTKTRVDEAPEALLLDRNGKTILTVETADISGLPEAWHWPEPLQLIADDGSTEIFGLMFRPSDFSPDKKYPVVDWAHTNPYFSRVPKGAFGADAQNGMVYMSAAALAELGFITLVIDGRGSCYRSKAFHDTSYKNIHKSSDLADHIAGIKQLANRYPFMDLDRVGIVDFDGSNGPAYGLLAYPEFYKVGALYSYWDERLFSQIEAYQGVVAEKESASVLCNMAANLRGKLLLMHGMRDPFMHIAGLLQLVDALVRANKNFDLVILPSGGHAITHSMQYGLRRMWDHLVTHLQGDSPPDNFHLSSGAELAIERMLNHEP